MQSWSEGGYSCPRCLPSVSPCIHGHTGLMRLIDSQGQMARTQDGPFCLHLVLRQLFLLSCITLQFECVVLDIVEFSCVSWREKVKYECVYVCMHASTLALAIQVVPVFHLESLTLSNLGNYDSKGSRDPNYIHLILLLPVIIARYGLNESFKLR